MIFSLQELIIKRGVMDFIPHQLLQAFSSHNYCHTAQTLITLQVIGARVEDGCWEHIYLLCNHHFLFLLINLPKVISAVYHSILKFRSDKSLTLVPCKDNHYKYDDLLPVSDIAFKGQTTHLDLRFLPKDSDAGNDYNDLVVKKLLHLLSIACPKLCTLEKNRRSNQQDGKFHREFALTTFLPCWMSLEVVYLNHACVTAACLRMILHCYTAETCYGLSQSKEKGRNWN